MREARIWLLALAVIFVILGYPWAALAFLLIAYLLLQRDRP